MTCQRDEVNYELRILEIGNSEIILKNSFVTALLKIRF